jgi:hypothetical protein
VQQGPRDGHEAAGLSNHPRSSVCWRARPLAHSSRSWRNSIRCITASGCPSSPLRGTSWFDALANAPGSKFAHVLVNGVRKIALRSLLAVPRLRHLYVMVVYRALRYPWGRRPSLRSYTPSPPTSSSGDVGWKQIPYFDLPKPVRQVRHTDLVPNVEHLHARFAAPAPLEPILSAVRLYISIPSYLSGCACLGWGGRRAHAEETVRRELEAPAAGLPGNVKCKAG